MQSLSKLAWTMSHLWWRNIYEAKAQWADFQGVTAHTKHAPYIIQSTPDFWADQLNHPLLVNTISAFAVLVQIMLLNPVGSVENERSFSAMNHLKNDQRKRLDECHTNCCARIKRCRLEINGLAFPFYMALQTWKNECDRRGGM